MPPKKPGAGLASAKKRPHEAPTKGRRAFAGTRQKVPRAGGAAADRFAAAKSAGGSVRGDGRDGDDADGDDMMDGALDVDDDGARGRKDEDDSGDDSDDEVKETADEKRLRLAKSYLEKLRAEEEEAGGDDSEDDDDDADARNLDSHDRLSNRLKNEAMQSYGRVRREVARRLVHDADDDDADDDRRGATLDALPIDASFIALVNHAFTLSERDAATFVDAFCASERLTAAFCEDAFDAVYAAYARRAPEDELTTLLELAKIFTTQYKMRAMPLETRVLDETLDAGRRCAAGDVDEAEARARIRDILERAFAIEGLKQRDYIIALREYRVKLERDSRSGKSYALEFLEADETLVAELCDPDSELRASEACRRELIVATDVIFRALDGFLEVAAR